MNQTEKTICGSLSKAFAYGLQDEHKGETTTRVFKCPGNTSIRLDDGLIFISLYNTTIGVISIKDRWIELNTKNYISEKIFRTNTTKSRLNMLLEICVPEARIYQKGYRWFVGLPSSDIPFVDGYRLPLPKELYYGVAS